TNEDQLVTTDSRQQSSTGNLIEETQFSYEIIANIGASSVTPPAEPAISAARLGSSSSSSNQRLQLNRRLSRCTCDHYHYLQPLASPSISTTASELPKKQKRKKQKTTTIQTVAQTSS